MKFAHNHLSMILAVVIVFGAIVAATGCDITSRSTPVTPMGPVKAAISVLDGTLIISHAATESEAGAGDEVSLVKGDRLSSGPSSGVTVKLPDESVLQLAPATTAEISNLSSEGEMVIRGLSGTLTLQARSDKVQFQMSSVTSFGLDSLEFSAKPTSDGAKMSMEVDDPQVQLAVEQGEAVLTINNVLYQAAAGTRVKALPGVEPEVVAATTPEATTPTPTSSPSTTAISGTPVLSQTYVYDPPTPLAPQSQASIASATTISLTWQSPVSVGPDEWYEIQLWQTTAAPFTVVGRTQSTSWSPDSALEPGDYRWRIQIVRLSDGMYLSPPSERREFTVVQSSVKQPTATRPAQLPTLPTAPGGGASSYHAPSAVSPSNNQVFEAEDTVVLTWESAGTLAGNQWYEVRLWENGTQWSGAAQTRSPSWQVPKDYNPGRYGWQVAVIVMEDGAWVKDISPQSEMRFFVWNAPPVVGGDDDDDGDGGGPPSQR